MLRAANELAKAMVWNTLIFVILVSYYKLNKLVFGGTWRLGDGFVPSLNNTCVNAIILVDPASSHMLVSKIKPCMSKYKLFYSETAKGSVQQLLFI